MEDGRVVKLRGLKFAIRYRVIRPFRPAWGTTVRSQVGASTEVSRIDVT